MPDLDLILSGHTHSRIQEPIRHGDTYVVSCGEYGKNLGSLSMAQKADGRWQVTDYQLIPITADIPADAETQEVIDRFMDTVDEDYLAQFGYTKDQVLAENDVVFSSLKDLGKVHTEHNLGDIIADAYVYAVENAADYDGVPVDLAVVPSGTVRDTYARGDITVEQVFNSFSLGIGADGVPGYPLIEVYLTGKELRTAAEIDASVSDFMTTARLYCSGLNFTYNPHRLLLNKVTDVYLVKDGQRVELQDDKLYRIVADLYSGQMLSAVTDMSYGILSIVPKYADGTPIEDFEDVILTENGRELKGWDAIARYMASFEDTDGDGIGNVPDYYSTLHDRKKVEDSRSLSALLKKPNRFAFILLGLILTVILLVVCLVLLLRKLVRKLRRRKKHVKIAQCRTACGLSGIVFSQSESPLLQAFQHLVQVAALGGVQTAHLVVGGCHVRHHHGDKTAGGTGAHAVVAVLQHKGAVTRSAQRLRCPQKNFRVGLGGRELLAGDDHLKIVGQTPAVQMVPDRRHPAGGGHCHRDVLRIQPCQNFVQSGLFGRRCLKRLFRLCVQRLDDGVRVAVFPVEAAQHRPHGVPCRAAGGNVQPFLIRKPKGGKCRLPQGSPDPLGVKHQAVHIKNNAVDHGSMLLP